MNVPMHLNKSQTPTGGTEPMAAYRTLLVHAEPGRASTQRVQVAARLARDLDAVLIGLGAEAFDPYPPADPMFGYAATEWLNRFQVQVNKDLTEAETAFRRDAGETNVEWRALQDFPHNALAHMARAADLIILSPRADSLAVGRTADPAGVIMGAGRPVLIVPPGRDRLLGDAVVIAWKDTRECRRAILDALPLLQRSQDVIVHTVCKADQMDAREAETADVVQMLLRHGVSARALVVKGKMESVEAAIDRVAELNGADLVVCGAYGHSRLREWVFGGVTDDMLHRPSRFVLMSH